jgi:hypothetical protein
MAEHFNNALQESLITLLCHNDEHGRIVANLIDPAMFGGDYRVIAERALVYWKEYGIAPKDHTADLVTDIISDDSNRKARNFRQILFAMSDSAKGINTRYIVDSCRNFLRLKKMEGTIMQAAETLSSQKELGIRDVEELLYKITTTREFDFNPGLRLTEIDRVLQYMEKLEGEFKLGIPPLDDRRIVPMRGATFMILAPSGYGKSWGVIHIGKVAVLQRKKVLHISLEMSEEQVMQRYYQSLLAITRREVESVELPRLKINSLGKLQAIEKENYAVPFSMDSPDIRMELEAHFELLGSKLENLIIKRFPTRSLTMNALRAYLDNLELVEKFIPDLVIIDAPYLMNHDPKNYRISLGRAFEEIRGIMIERNMAGVFTHQISREGAKAATVQTTHISEDWSIVQTSDMILTYSATDPERKLGLARLYVSKARDEQDKFGVLLTQKYETGQFALQSMFLDDKYWDRLKEVAPDEDEVISNEDEDDDGD